MDGHSGERGPLAEAWRDDHGDPDSGTLDPAWQAEHARLLADNERMRAALVSIAGAPTSWLDDGPVRRIAKAALTSSTRQEQP